MKPTLFSSKVRVALLELFLLNPENDFYLREVVTRSGYALRSVQRELENLFSLGLVERRKRGNRHYYKVNRKSSVFKELKTVILKTAGLAGALSEAVGESRGVDVAFVYGSYASNVEDMHSDLDLFVVGDLKGDKLYPVIHQVEKQLGREINYVVFTPQEVRKRLASKDDFVSAVLGGRKIFVKGSKDELRKVVAGGGRLASKAGPARDRTKARHRR